MHAVSTPKNAEEQTSLGTNWFLWATLIVAFYYQIYRYPFEYGIEPPLFWRVGKYALLAGFCMLSSALFFKKIKSFGVFEWGFLLVFSVLSVFGYLQQEKYLIQAAVSALVAFWIVQSSPSIPYRALAKFLVVAWFVNTLFYFIQWIGLVFFDKSFVHASDQVLTSRFGGMFVEPLGAPYLSFLFLGLAYEFKGWAYWVITITSVLTLLMTHTLTAALFLFLLAVAYAGFFLLKKAGLLASIVWCASGFIAAKGVIAAFWYLKDSVPYLSGKWNVSIVAHAKYWWPDRWPLLPAQESMFSETWWVMSVQSMGVLWTIVYVAVVFFLLRACVSQAKLLLSPRADGSLKGVFLGIYLSGAFVIFGSLNQLYPAMYPVGLLFMLFSFMVKYNKISETMPPKEG